MIITIIIKNTFELLILQYHFIRNLLKSELKPDFTQQLNAVCSHTFIIRFFSFFTWYGLLYTLNNRKVYLMTFKLGGGGGV